MYAQTIIVTANIIDTHHFLNCFVYYKLQIKHHTIIQQTHKARSVEPNCSILFMALSKYIIYQQVVVVFLSVFDRNAFSQLQRMSIIFNMYIIRDRKLAIIRFIQYKPQLWHISNPYFI